MVQGFGGYSVKDGRRGEEPGYQATRVVSRMQAADGYVELETTETAKKSQTLRDLPAVGPGWMEVWLKQVAVLNGRVKADARTLLYTGFFSMMNWPTLILTLSKTNFAIILMIFWLPTYNQMLTVSSAGYTSYNERLENQKSS